MVCDHVCHASNMAYDTSVTRTGVVRAYAAAVRSESVDTRLTPIDTGWATRAPSCGTSHVENGNV